ncbi:hypothetical protein [Falsiruegeria mediterranea]
MKLETIDEILSAKAEILRLLPASYSWLIIRLIQLAETTDLTAEDRQEAALKLVLSMLTDIPVLNADGRLLAPLYELLDDHMNNPKNGGKPHRHGALQAAGMAYVEICKENGEAVGKAQEHVAKTMREAG